MRKSAIALVLIGGLALVVFAWNRSRSVEPDPAALVQQRFDRQLPAGTSRADAEALLRECEVTYDFNEFDNRLEGTIRSSRRIVDDRGIRAVVYVTVELDESGRVVRANARDVFTYR